VDDDREMDYMKVKGRLEMMFQSARGLSLVIGGFIATSSYELAYVLTLAVHGLSLATALTFTEPLAGRVKPEPGNRGVGSLIRHCKDSVAVIRATRGSFLYILFIETFSLFYTTLYFYFQNFLKLRGYLEGAIGLVLALSATASVIAATQAHRIEKKLGRLVLIRVTPFLAIAAFALIAFTPLESFAMILLSLMEGVLFVSFSDYINRMIPSTNRATILSFQAMVFSIMMVVFFPAIGALSQSHGFKPAFVAIFALSALVLLGAQQMLLRSITREGQAAVP
jgi:hypothetical protein